MMIYHCYFEEYFSILYVIVISKTDIFLALIISRSLSSWNQNRNQNRNWFNLVIRIIITILIIVKDIGTASVQFFNVLSSSLLMRKPFDIVGSGAHDAASSIGVISNSFAVPIVIASDIYFSHGHRYQDYFWKRFRCGFRSYVW